MIRTLRNAWRGFVIVRTLARHDALFPLERLGAPRGAVAGLRLFGLFAPRAHSTGRPGQRLGAALQDLGPSFVKFGQSLSTRPDIVGEDVALDLGELRDRLPPFPAATARAAIADSLGRPVEALFARFSGTPLAAASIAQAHAAELPDGRRLVVKVLRPGIEARFRRDVEFFAWGADLVERLRADARRLRPREVVRTFAETVAMEMDLRLEAAAASQIAENFADDPTFQVPEVDWSRTGRRVLALSRVEGIPINDRAALIAGGRDPAAIVRNLFSAFLNQVFRDGFFHADLHPGNLFVDADNNILAVDFGIVGRLDAANRRYVAELLLAFVVGDYRRAAEVHFEAGYVPANQSVEAFAQACRSIGEPIFGLPVEEISIGRLLAQLFEITETFAMQTQPQLLLLQKTLVVVEGVCRHLMPGVNLWTIARPLLERHVAATIGVEATLRDGMAEATTLVRRLPRLVQHAEALAAMVTADGVRLHPDSARAIAAEQARRRRPWQLAAVAVLLVAAAVLLT